MAGASAAIDPRRAGGEGRIGQVGVCDGFLGQRSGCEDRGRGVGVWWGGGGTGGGEEGQDEGGEERDERSQGGV